MADPAIVLADLRAEGDVLDELVDGIGAAAWSRPTPAPGWTIAHQIAHLAWTDEVAIAAATDAPAFQQVVDRALAAPDGYVDAAAGEGARRPPMELLEAWRRGRAELLDVLAAVPEGDKLPWFGPPMSPTSMATARLMETWAHGLDVAEALSRVCVPTERLRHVAHIGVRTRDYAYHVNGLTPPAEAFRVELTAPSGAVWTWGPDDAAQRVSGPALDFCLLVTQRRNRADLAVIAAGTDADRWLDVAQAFAGLPGPGRPAESSA